MFKIITIIVSIFLLATVAIGMECYDKNKDFGNSKKSNKGFLIFMLVSAILSFLASAAAIGITRTP